MLVASGPCAVKKYSNMFDFLLTSSLGRICNNHEFTVAMCMTSSNDNNCLIWKKNVSASETLLTQQTLRDFIFWIYCSNTQVFCFLKIDNYLPLGFFYHRLMQLKVLLNDSRCSCGKPRDTKEEQKNPPTELRYHAITLVSFCKGMLLIWCCEISWNYLNCLYIFAEKWLHLGHMVWVFAFVLLLFTESKCIKILWRNGLLKKLSFHCHWAQKAVAADPKVQVYRQTRSLFPCSFFYDLWSYNSPI